MMKLLFCCKKLIKLCLICSSKSAGSTRSLMLQIECQHKALVQIEFREKKALQHKIDISVKNIY